jgi:chromosome partitioning protein
MKIITVINNKGGVGKTITAVNLSACLATMGYKVGLIDIDSQDQSQLSFEYERTSDLKRVLIREETLTVSEMCETQIPNLYILPNNGDITDTFFFSRQNIDSERRVKILSNTLRHCRDFDFIIIDCNPNMDIQAINALIASHYVLIPTMLNSMAIDGTFKFMAKTRKVIEQLNPTLKILGILLGNHRSSNWLFPSQLEDELRKQFSGLVLNSKIRTNSNLDRIASQKQTIFDTPKINAGVRKGMNDFISLSEEILEIIKND